LVPLDPLPVHKYCALMVTWVRHAPHHNKVITVRALEGIPSFHWTTATEADNTHLMVISTVYIFSR
jgi:hypothetical protein